MRIFIVVVAVVGLALRLPNVSKGQETQAQPEYTAVELTEEAIAINREALLVDGHNDLPWAIRELGSSFAKVDIRQPQSKLHTDIPRLREGGLKAQFWSVYVPASTDLTGNALLQTMEQIDLVHEMIARYPDAFEMVHTADDIERIVASGKIASMIGVEGGYSIQNSIGVLQRLYDRGARYMTLTHSKTLDWADSATDEPRHGGLTPFGEDVVREMNRIGMLVDLSHVSPDTMLDALRVTQAPVIFSHSSARAICDHPRNVSDEVLKLIPANGGVVMVNFFSGFIVPTEQMKQDRTRRGTLKDVVDHIEQIIQVAGIDHVGIGSDFDGVPRLPLQLDDVAHYPYITQELLNRGYNREQIEKILGKNLLRVLRQAEAVSRKLKGETPTGTKILVHTGKFDRPGGVVECPVDREVFGKGGVVRLVSSDGVISVFGQIGPPKLNSKVDPDMSVLTFVLPTTAAVPADTTVEFTYQSAALPEKSFQWTDFPDTHRDLTYGNRPVLRYVYEALDKSSQARIDDTFKPYHHWFDPAGKMLVTKGTGGLYPHHRGLSYAFNGITYGDQQADVWHCRDGEFQSHEKFISEDVGPVYGRHQVQIDWHGRDGMTFASEVRELTAYAVDGGSLVEFRSRLATLLPQVRLAGDPQHAGFQFRAAQEVADLTKDQTFYIRPDGKDPPGVFRNWSSAADETEINRKHVDLPWNALSFVLGGQRFTCGYLDHPANPKPARFSERDYGRFGSDFEFNLSPDHPLDVGYRVWLQEGEMSVDDLRRWSQDLIDPCRAEPLTD